MAAVVVIFGGLLALSRLGAGDEVRTTDQPTTTSFEDNDDARGTTDPDDVAVRFAETFEALDPIAAEALLSPEAEGVQFTLTSLRESVAEEYAAWQAVGGRAQLQGCEALPTEGTYRCLFLIDDKLSRAQAIDPLELPFTVVVEDGQVMTARIDVARYDQWTDEVWGPFGDWIRTERLAETPTAFPAELQGLPNVVDPEARAVYEQMIDDFVQEVGRPSLTENQP